MSMYLHGIYGTGAWWTCAFMILIVDCTRLNGATQANIPEPIVADDEPVYQGNRCARAYGF